MEPEKTERRERHERRVMANLVTSLRYFLNLDIPELKEEAKDLHQKLSAYLEPAKQPPHLPPKKPQGPYSPLVEIDATFPESSASSQEKIWDGVEKWQVKPKDEGKGKKKVKKERSL